MRGEYDVAAFQAMKAVEVAVRDAGGFSAGDLGVDLMRKAFHEDTGPLTDKSVEKSEPGSIGSIRRGDRFLQKSSLPSGRKSRRSKRGFGNRAAREPPSSHCR
jgi:hypothetical protein